MDLPILFFKTILFRPYVFVFLAAFLFAAIKLIGWPRTWRFWLISWATAFVCEFSSTRNGIPFGWYHYNGSTVGQELYFSNIPFMDSLSFSFLLYAAYCVSLCFLLPSHRSSDPSRRWLTELHLDLSTRTSWSVLMVTALLLCFHRHGHRSSRLAGRPLVPGQDLLLPRPRHSLRRAPRELCRLGRRRIDLALHLFPIGQTTPSDAPPHQPFHHRTASPWRLASIMGCWRSTSA